MKRIVTGGRAKNFTLKDQHGEPVNLSGFKGKRVLLSFHPIAWTPVCSKQMKALEKNCRKFEKLNMIPLGLSVDTVPSKYAWAKALGIKKIKLLADFWPHGRVAKLYGIFRDKNGFSERANIVIDENRKVVFARQYPIEQLPDIKEIIGFLGTLPVL